MNKEDIYLVSFNKNVTSSLPAKVGVLRDVSLDSSQKEEIAQQKQSAELASMFNRLHNAVNGFVQRQSRVAYDGMSAPSANKTVRSVADALVNQHIAVSIPDVNAVTDTDFDDEIKDYYDSSVHPLLSYGKSLFSQGKIPNYVFHAMMIVEYDLNISPEGETSGTKKAQKLAKRVHKFLDKRCRGGAQVSPEVSLVAYSFLYNRLSEALSDSSELTGAAYHFDDTEDFESLDEMIEHVAVMNELPDTLAIKENLYDATVHLNNIANETDLEKRLHVIAKQVVENLQRLNDEVIIESADIVPLPGYDN